MYLGGFSTQWWEEIFLVGIFSQDIIKKHPKKHDSIPRVSQCQCEIQSHWRVTHKILRVLKEPFFKILLEHQHRGENVVFWGWKRGFSISKWSLTACFRAIQALKNNIHGKFMMTERIKNLEHRIKICERFSHWARTKRSPNRGDWTAKHANRRR